MKLLELGRNVWLLGPQGPKQGKIIGASYSIQIVNDEEKEAEAYIIDLDGQHVQAKKEEVFISFRSVKLQLKAWMSQNQ